MYLFINPKNRQHKTSEGGWAFPCGRECLLCRGTAHDLRVAPLHSPHRHSMFVHTAAKEENTDYHIVNSYGKTG